MRIFLKFFSIFLFPPLTYYSLSGITQTVKRANHSNKSHLPGTREERQKYGDQN
nr:MAG TPA: hypothetical protein [Caudoviricetes sp.]